MKRAVLGELCDFFNGGAWSDKEYVNAGIPVLKVTNCKSTGFQLDSLNYLSEKSREKYKKNELVIGDVIIATVGSHPNLIESAAGRSCIVNSQVEGFYLNQNAVCVRTKDKKVLSQKYLGYLCKCADFQHYIQSRGRGAANQMRIAISSIREYSFTLPDIENQQYIADTLSAYDDLIENNQKQIKLLEEAAQRLYKEWFVDLRFPGHENTKIVDAVPEGWSESTVSEVSAVLRRGISPKYNEKARGIVINQKCIRQTIVSYDEARTQEKKYPAELEMMESDIVICSTGAGTLGRVGQIFEAKENVTLDSHVTLIRANEKIGQQSLFWSLKMKQDYLMNAGKGSTNQLELSRETIGSCEILIPERKIAEQVEKNFVAIHNKMKECSMQIARLREARNLLLPKLMSGEVEV